MDAGKGLKGGDLYAVLALANQRELSPLVQVIMSRKTNTLKSQQLYRLHKPDHTKYHWLIGNEIRLYGGNSWANLARREGPDYAKIVDDVCNKLGVNITGMTLKDEDTVLQTVAPSGSELRKKLECFDLGEDAWNTIQSSVSEGWWGAKMTAGVIASIVAAPVGLPLLLKTAVDPTYQITVPCVLHIAFSRQKFLDEKRGL